MTCRVVNTIEHDIFKRKTALVRHLIISAQSILTETVILFQHIHQVRNAKSTFSRHNAGTSFRNRMVQANSQMALTLFNKARQSLSQTHTRHSNTFRTPCPTPTCRKDLRSFQHSVQVVKRFSLSHKHDVCQRVTLRQRVNLVQDIRSSQRSHIPLSTRHAKGTPHFTSHLRTHTQRSAFTIWNINSLNKVAFSGSIQILHRAIHRSLFIHRRRATNGKPLSQFSTYSFRKISHLFNALHSLAVNPFSNLFAHKSFSSHFRGNGFEFIQTHS